MIHATFPAPAISAAPAGPASPRTITGTAVPYNVPGRVSDGRTVIFHPGSLDAAARPVALFDHDRARPLGRVVDATEHPDGLDVTVKVSATAAGNDALVLAADDVLGAFSVGAEPTEAAEDPDGTLHVYAADWLELSLLTLGAFPTARVATVTARPPEEIQPVTITDPAVNTAPLDSDAPDDDDDDNPDIEPDEPASRAPAVPVTAAAGPRRRGDELTLARLGPMIHAGRAGNRAARQRVQSELSRCTVEAALADVVMVGTNNVAGMYRPAYQAEIVDIVDHGSPLVNVLRQGDLTNGDFPNKTFVRWILSPQVALQTAEKAEINSGPARLDIVNVPVQTWATGNDISRQTLDLGPPSFVEEWVRAASADYAATIETYAETALLAAATNVTTVVGDTFIQVVGKLFAAMSPTAVPAGRLFMAVSYDIAAAMIGVTAQNGPAFWGGDINLANFTPDANVGGLDVIIATAFPARTYLLGMSTAATWYDAPGVPYTLQAVNVGKLGLDIGLYGYGALGVQYPGAFVKTTQPSA